MKKTGYFLLLILFCLSFTACRTTPVELTQAAALMETAPDSALNILRRHSPKEYTSDKNKALYGLLLIQATDGVKLPLRPDSSLDFSINYYLKHPDNDRLATCYLFKARAYKYNFKYEKAIDFYLKALDAIQNEQDAAALYGRINLDLGDIHSVQNDFALARGKYQLASNYFTEIRFQPQAFYALLNIGRTYHAAKEYKKAELFYSRIIKYAKDSLQQGALFQEMGLNYYDFKKTDSAKIYLKRIIDYPYITNNRAIRYFFLSRIYFDTEEIDSAFLFASRAFRYNPDIRTQRECYRIMTNCEFAHGHVDKVTFYMNKYVQLGDSLRKIDAQTKGSYIETLHYTKAESLQNKNKFWIAICLLFVGSLLAYLLIKRLKHHSKKTLKQTHETFIQQKADIRKELVHKKRAALLDKVASIKSEQALERKPASMAERELQLKNMYEKLIHLNDPVFFFREMDTLFNDLVSKLQNRYPTLNTKELTWCCLYLLKTPTHDMLILLDYKTDNSLKRMKNRLSEKTDTKNAALLGELLFNIVSEDGPPNPSTPRSGNIS